MTLFIENINTPGLAHRSYILGHQGRACVIDPRRDISVYLDKVEEKEVRITHIFETHRNEDYVVGSVELAQKTGARILHGQSLDFEYGHSVKDGDTFSIGDITLEIIETPGHTLESICIAVRDTAFGKDVVALFTGDTLFIGDVGRTDFYPNRKEEVAGMLYDAIFDKLLPLGDQAIIYPAHGSGSVCGSGMAERDFSTLGYERCNNPMLVIKSRQEFIDAKLKENHYKPAYFKQMEYYNQKGNPPQVGEVRTPPPLSADQFSKAMSESMQAVDCRSPEAFAGAFIPGSLALPVSLVSAYAGYFLDYDRPIGLVTHGPEDAKFVKLQLIRMGYDNIAGYLPGELEEWETSGRKYDRIGVVHTASLVKKIKASDAFTLLDVRKADEFNDGHLPDALHIYLGHLMDQLDEIPENIPVTTFCGSGMRAIVAASILKNRGYEHVDNALGSIAACSEVGCPLEKE